MRIAIIIPSYNESDNIAFVTAVIDQGLGLAVKRFSQITAAIIVNVDNSSLDKTGEIFRKTPTHFPKLSLKTVGRPGKGKNLIYFLKRFSEDYDVFATLDADLKSIEPDWIMKLIGPFLREDEKCDFVWPLYQRSRFEGSTTNHFAYPLIYSFFGRDIRQPIAGDFAFSQRLAVKIIKDKIPPQAYFYGIDILFSIRAVQYANYFRQVNLGQKTHKPSFAKLEDMFPQIAAAAVDALRPAHIKKSIRIRDINKFVCISSSRDFQHARAADQLLAEKIKFLSRNLDSVVWLDSAVAAKVRWSLNDQRLSDGLWSVILGSWLRYALDYGRIDSLKLAKELLPFFVFRTISFWQEVAVLRPAEVERAIRRQAGLIRKIILA
jgi:glycosyltransferase involved in cell wall biosynthesis